MAILRMVITESKIKTFKQNCQMLFISISSLERRVYFVNLALVIFEMSLDGNSLFS